MIASKSSLLCLERHNFVGGCQALAMSNDSISSPLFSLEEAYVCTTPTSNGYALTSNTNFEAPGLQVLEDAIGIILAANPPQSRKALAFAVRSEDILTGCCVIEEKERIRNVLGFGLLIDSSKDRGCELHHKLVVRNFRPPEVQVEC